MLRLSIAAMSAAALMVSSIASALAAPPRVHPTFDLRALPHEPPHELRGILKGVMGSTAIVQIRNGKDVTVDADFAFRNHLTTVLYPGRAVLVIGTVGSDHVLHAISIQAVHVPARYWSPDR